MSASGERDAQAAVAQLATNPRPQFEAAVKTLQQYVSNIIEKPNEPKYRRIKLENAIFVKHVRQAQGGVAFLKALGFCEGGGVLELYEPNIGAMRHALQLLLEMRPAMAMLSTTSNGEPSAQAGSSAKHARKEHGEQPGVKLHKPATSEEDAAKVEAKREQVKARSGPYVRESISYNCTIAGEHD